MQQHFGTGDRVWLEIDRQRHIRVVGEVEKVDGRDRVRVRVDEPFGYRLLVRSPRELERFG